MGTLGGIIAPLRPKREFRGVYHEGTASLLVRSWVVKGYGSTSGNFPSAGRRRCIGVSV